MPWLSWLFWRQQQKTSDDDTQHTKAPKSDEANSRGEPANTNSSSLQPGDITSQTNRSSWDTSLNKTDWSQYTSRQAITMSILTTATTLFLRRLYKIHLRRIPTADHIKPDVLRNRSLFGYVTSVGDGDNFRLFHTPGGRLMGWGWLGKGRRVQEWEHRDFKDKTLSVRIAGVDAPEAAHFGRPAQPHSQEALDWLRGFVLHRYVRVWPYRQDQYGRVVCSVERRNWGFFKSDVGLEMLRRGLATVYEAKFGSEFGSREKEYHEAEERARAKRVGMWQEPGLIGKILGRRKQKLESPRDYKTRIKQQEGNAKTAELAK